VVEVQVPGIEDASAVLTGVFVASEDIMPGELDFLFRHPVIQGHDDDLRQHEGARYTAHGIWRGGGMTVE
jgi:hypothetical protein